MRLVLKRLLRRSGRGWIDPDFGWARGRLRSALGKPLGVRGIGRGEHAGPRGHPLLRQAVAHVIGRQQAEAGVSVLGKGLYGAYAPH